MCYGCWKELPSRSPIEGDSGWIPVWCRHQLEVFKLWYRLSNMDDSRLTKQIFNWSLALADKGKATWCLHVRKLLSRINLDHLCPSNITSLSPREFQNIITSKLINLANQNWRMRIWDPRAYSLDSGGRLLNYRIVKQLPCPEHYLSNVHCKGHRWVIAALREEDAFLYKWKQAAIDSRKPHTTFRPADFAVLERLKRNSIS